MRAEQIPLDADDPRAIALADVVQVVRLKSARYSVVHPTVLGMVWAGASPRAVAAVEAVLEPWGCAFQLRDDDLGVFGDPAVTGKPAGDDLLEGKRTALLALTWREADHAGRDLIARTLGRRDLGADDVEALTRLISVNGRAPHEAMIEDLLQRGRTALAESGLDAPARGLLDELGMLLVRRSA